MKDSNDDLASKGGETVLLHLRSEQSSSRWHSPETTHETSSEDHSAPNGSADDGLDSVFDHVEPTEWADLFSPFTTEESAQESFRSDSVLRGKEGWPKGPNELQQDEARLIDETIERILKKKPERVETKAEEEEFGNRAEQEWTTNFDSAWSEPHFEWHSFGETRYIRLKGVRFFSSNQENSLDRYDLLAHEKSTVRNEASSCSLPHSIAKDLFAPSFENLPKKTVIDQEGWQHTKPSFDFEGSPTWSEKSTETCPSKFEKSCTTAECTEREASSQLPEEKQYANQEEISFGNVGARVLVTITHGQDCSSPGGFQSNDCFEESTADWAATKSTDESPNTPVSTPEAAVVEAKSDDTENRSMEKSNSVDKSITSKDSEQSDYVLPLPSEKPVDEFTKFVVWMNQKVREGDPSLVVEDWFGSVYSKTPIIFPTPPSLTNEGRQESHEVQSTSMETAVNPTCNSHSTELSREDIMADLALVHEEGETRTVANDVVKSGKVDKTLQDLFGMATVLSFSEIGEFSAPVKAFQEGKILDDTEPVFLRFALPRANLSEAVQELGDQIWGEIEGLAQEPPRQNDSKPKHLDASVATCEPSNLVEALDMPRCVGQDTVKDNDDDSSVADGDQDSCAFDERMDTESTTEPVNTERCMPDGDSKEKLQSSHHQSLSAGTANNTANMRKGIPRARALFPSKGGARPKIQRNSPMIPVLPLNDLNHKSIGQTKGASLERKNARPKLRWFSVRDIRRSIQRARKDGSTVASKKHKVKKSVRFNNPLVQVHTYEQEEEEDDAETLFSYYYHGLLASLEKGGSDDESNVSEDFSTSDGFLSASDGFNPCFVNVGPGSPLDCNGFNPLVYPERNVDDDWDLESGSRASLDDYPHIFS